MRRLGLCLVALLCVVPLLADSTLVRFQGGIGVHPVRGIGAGGVVVRNDVLGVPPGGIPWVIRELSATVQTDGGISVEGRGLLLAGGNGVGTNGGQSVKAVLFCGTADPHSSQVVPLEPNGDFHIEDDVLSPIPPNPCSNPVLLIESAGGAWFAAGIQARRSDSRGASR